MFQMNKFEKTLARQDNHYQTKSSATCHDDHTIESRKRLSPFTIRYQLFTTSYELFSFPPPVLRATSARGEHHPRFTIHYPPSTIPPSHPQRQKGGTSLFLLRVYKNLKSV